MPFEYKRHSNYSHQLPPIFKKQIKASESHLGRGSYGIPDGLSNFGISLPPGKKFERECRTERWTASKAFHKIPVYVLGEEEITNRVILEKILKQNREVKFLGFDCEWVNDGSSDDPAKEPHPVALLQLCTLDDCLLIKICDLSTRIPNALKNVLEDRSILKFGVGVDEDCKRLRSLGINICGTVDIRFIVQRCQFKRDVIKHPERINGLSLKSLASSILGIEMEKSFRIRCSNWQAKELSDKQISYATNDAIIGLQIFLALSMQKMHSKQIMHLQQFCKKKSDQIDGEKLLLMSFLSGRVFEFDQSMLSIGSWDIWNGFSDYCVLNKEISDLGSSLCRGVTDLAFKNKNKPFITTNKPQKSSSESCLSTMKAKTIPVRRTPLYHNCLLMAPDGTVLCTCDKKKAQWYVTREIGHVVKEDPFTVQLKFDPSGRPFVDRDYYTTEKENRCVVCGKTDEYVKKMVVPRDYRRHFPSHLKDHLSHDCLLLCVLCHKISEVHDLQLKRKIAQDFSVPLNTCRHADDPALKRVRSAAKALFHSSNQIPEERRRKLELSIKEFTGNETMDDVNLKELSEIGTTRENDYFQGSHGERVVQQLIKDDKVKDFIKMWREHFLSNMRPKFLPKLWSSDHNLAKFDQK
eukprot:gene3755-4277_t